MADIKCNLIIDSCCDLPREAIDIDGVELLQFPFLIDGEEHFDDMFASMAQHDFYEKMRKGSECSTAQIPVPVLHDAFERAIESGVPTVYIGFSGGLSGTFGTAETIAAQLLQDHPGAELYVVDSCLASVAEGVLVNEALRQREQGLTASQMVDWVNEARFFVNELFTLDSLDWLRKGGRIPASVAFAGSKLDVKPVLGISHDGKLSLAGAARGRKKGIKQLVDFYQKNADELGAGTHVIIGSADCPKDADKLKDALLKVDDTIVFTDTAIGPVIGSHVGPGMLALAFMGKDTRDSLTVSDRIANKVRQKQD